MKDLRKLRHHLPKIEKILHHTFNDQQLLLTAFTHSSYVNEHTQAVRGNNERLEFVGDGVLNLLVIEYLYQTFPHSTEGELSSLRAHLVRKESCFRLLQQLHLGKFLLLGKGEKKQREQIDGTTFVHNAYANLFEAILGAIYMDGTLRQCKHFFFSHFHSTLEEMVRQWTPFKDAKTELQKHTQKLFHTHPHYAVLESRGPDHSKEYVVQLFIDTPGEKRELARGVGTSKREAEQRAAEHALALLQANKGFI